MSAGQLLVLLSGQAVRAVGTVMAIPNSECCQDLCMLLSSRYRRVILASNEMFVVHGIFAMSHQRKC